MAKVKGVSNTAGVQSIDDQYTAIIQGNSPSSSGSLEPINVEGYLTSKPKTITDVNPSNQMSMPIGEDMPVAKEKSAEQLFTDYRQGQAILAGAQFVSDYLNANAAYSTVKGQAQLNILQARNQGADALYRGRQAQMDRQSEGYQQGQDALLAMAAQGQDVQGAGVQKIQASLEAMGIYNGMQEEINAMKEALGYDLEEVNYRYQISQAKNQRDAAVLGSAINFGANLVGVI